MDNLGSVRCIVSWDGASVSTQAFDYKPFGDLQETGEENRIGYFGEQRDKESDYFAMGFRLYDPEIGRFLAIDPLLDLQPSQTPYHYCFNNPTSFTDPTGLYPEKEKGDKVQAMEINSWYIGQQIQQLARDNEANMEAERLFSKWSARMFSDWSFGEFLQYKGIMSMFFSNSIGRVGASSDAVNGFFLGPEQRAAIQNNIRVEAGNGVDNPDQAVQSFWNKFWTANQYMTQENYEYYTRHFIIVRLFSDTDFENYSIDQGTPKAIGWHTDANGVSVITFAASMFTNSAFKFGRYETGNYGGLLDNNVYMTILHEFGHGYAYYDMRSEYSNMDNVYKENWAYNYVNNYWLAPRGEPLQNYKTTIHFDILRYISFGLFNNGYNP